MYETADFSYPKYFSKLTLIHVLFPKTVCFNVFWPTYLTYYCITLFASQSCPGGSFQNISPFFVFFIWKFCFSFSVALFRNLGFFSNTFMDIITWTRPVSNSCCTSVCHSTCYSFLTPEALLAVTRDTMFLTYPFRFGFFNAELLIL